MKDILNGNLKIAVQKDGRLTDDSLGLLGGINLEFESFKRQLYLNCSNFPASIIFTRDDDIPEFVDSGTADVGIVGSDVYAEQNLSKNSEVVMKLDFGKCKLALAVPESSDIKSVKDLAGKKIATSFPTLTQNFLTENKIDAEIIKLQGGVEIAPSLDLADAIVDLVSSGFTLKVNGLRVLTDVQPVYAVLIANNELSMAKRNLLKQIVLRIESLQAAKNYKYIMLNLPKSKLSAIVATVPGLKSPTVADLADPGWVSVQTVIKEEFFWEIIAQLKEQGAKDILVMPIEKIIY